VNATVKPAVEATNPVMSVAVKDTSTTGATTPPRIAPAIAKRLRAERIGTCQEWRALGPKRGGIFGITKRARERIDAVVAAELERFGGKP
jgi:hypothetical protein